MKLETYFEDAINNADWEKVCKVYTKITGKEIQPPILRIPLAELDMDDDGEMIGSHDEMEMDDDEDDHQPPPPEQPPPPHSDYMASSKSAMQTKYGRRESIGKPKNTWEDDRSLASKDLPTKNKELAKLYSKSNSKKEPTDKRRTINTANRVTIECCECKRQFEVSSVEAAHKKGDDGKNVYKCNGCCVAEAKGNRRTHAK